MWNVPQKIIDIIIAVLLMFLIPVTYFNIKKDNLIQVNTDRLTTEFVSQVSANGSINRDMYEKYSSDLSATNKLYQVDLTHEQTAFEPEYILRSASEVIEEDEDLWTGTNDYYAPEVITEIPEVTDPISTGSLNTETNESIMAKAVNTPASSSHVHTEECYAGHRHAGSKSFTHTHKHTSSCRRYDSFIVRYVICGSCGRERALRYESYYWDDNTSQVVVAQVSHMFECYLCGANNSGNGIVRIEKDVSYSCGYNKDINGDGWTDETDTTNTYEYVKSYPQRNDVRFTATSGCYKYHQHVPFPSGWNWVGQYVTYSAEHFRTAARNGIDAYCSIPSQYTIRWSNEYGGSYSCTYGAVVNGDGTISFNFLTAYGNVIGNQQSYWHNYPQTVTWDWLANLSNSYYAENLFESVYNVEFGNFSYYYSLGFNAYGSISRCSEPAPYNQWYTTCGQVENATLACNQIIQELTPTNPVQTVLTGDQLITTALATFRDGSTKTVVCTTPFSTASITQNQEVTLTYNYTINGSQYQSECTITVTVIPRTKICTHGHTYNLNVDGSNPGCPYCRNWLRSLAVFAPSGGMLTMYRNESGSLETEGVGLIAIYLDGHTEYVYNGYVDNLDPDYVGTQTVTIGYKGLTTTLTVRVIRNRKLCDVCGLYYDLYMDDTDPGCPYCKAKVPVFTGNIMKYTAATYDDEIITELYEGSGTYYFRRGDVFTVKAKDRNILAYRSIFGRLFGLNIDTISSNTIKNEVLH